MTASILHRTSIFILVGSLLFHPLIGGLTIALAQPSESIGIISNVSGETLLSSSNPSTNSQPLSFRQPIVYGDRIQTGEKAVLAMLVANNALITAHELSEFMVTQSSTGQEAIQLFKGQTCLATPQNNNEGAEGITLMTPGTMVKAAPGSTIRISLEDGATDASVEPSPSFPKAQPVSFTPFSPALVRTAGGRHGLPLRETIEVLEGSADLVSQIPGVAPVNLAAGTQVRVIEGSFGPKSAGTGRSCRVADIGTMQGLTQAVIQPPHTVPPSQATKSIINKQQDQAKHLVAAVTGEGDPVVAATESTSQQSLINTQDSNTVIIPTTNVDPEVFPENSPSVFLVSFNNSTVGLDTQFPNTLLSATEGGATSVTPNSLQNIDGFNGNLSGILGTGAITTTNTPGETAIIPGGFFIRNSTITGQIPGIPLGFISGSLLVDSPSPFVNSTSPLFQFENSIVNGVSSGLLLEGNLHLRGPLFVSNASTLNYGVGSLIFFSPTIFFADTSSSFVSEDINPVIQLNNTTISSIGNLIELVGGLSLGQSNIFSLQGPLLDARNTNLLSSSLLTVSDLTISSDAGTRSLDPFINLREGTTVTTQGGLSLIDLLLVFQTLSSDTEIDVPVLHVDNSQVNASGRIFEIDLSVLDATAPLAKILNGSTVTTGQSGSNVGEFAQLNNSAFSATIPNDALVMLDASSITIPDGSFFSLFNSTTNITGNLLALQNGSTLNINNGFLLSLSGTSVFNLSGGSLAVGGGAGPNTINITNNVAGTIQSIGGIPVLLTGGALPGQVNVGPGFIPFNGVTVNTNGTGVIQVNGPGAQVTLN